MYDFPSPSRHDCHPKIGASTAAISPLSSALVTVCAIAAIGCGPETTDPRPSPDAADADASVRDIAETGTPDAAEADAGEANSPPVADAGEDRVAAVGEEVVLDASGSNDPDSDGLSYSWSITSQPDGASPTLSRADNVAARFQTDTAGTYELEVVVSDGQAETAASATVEVLSPPTADAGPDKTGEVGQPVELDGSNSTVPEGTEPSYAWSFLSKPDSSGASLESASTPVAQFEPDVEGAYVVELTVGHEAAESTDRATVEVAPAGGRLTSTVHVSPDGSDDNKGTQQEPLRTIGAAVELVQSKEDVRRIRLASGTYDAGEANMTLAQTVDIVGPSGSSEKATIEGSGSGPMFDITSDGYATFTDVTLEMPAGRAVEVGDDAGCSWIDVTCRAETCLYSGDLFGQPGGQIDVEGSTLNGAGIDSSNGVIATSPDDLAFADSTIRGFSDQGLNIVNGALTARRTTFRENSTAVHLRVNGSADATRISDATFDANGTALKSEGAQNVEIQVSTIQQSGGRSVVVDGGAVVVDGSELTDGSDHGVVALDNAVVTLRDTDVLDHAGDGVRVEGAGARVDLGTDTSQGNNLVQANNGEQLHDVRPDGASGRVTLSETQLGTLIPPASTYSGPDYRGYGMVIENDNQIRAY